VAMEDLRLNELRIICSEKNSALLGEGISIHGIETPCLMKEARRFAGRRYSEGWRSQDGGAVSRGVPKIRIAGCDTVRDGVRKMEAPYRGEFRKFASQVLASVQVQGSPRSIQRPFREHDKKQPLFDKKREDRTDKMCNKYSLMKINPPLISLKAAFVFVAASAILTASLETSIAQNVTMSGNFVTVPGGTLNGTAVTAFQISKFEVTWGEWQEVRASAVAMGYSDLVDHDVIVQ